MELRMILKTSLTWSLQERRFTLGGAKKFSFLTQGYKKVRSPDVVQLQLSDHGDVDVCGEIKSEELKTDTHTHTQNEGFLCLA